jgi:hypothetical protein
MKGCLVERLNGDYWKPAGPAVGNAWAIGRPLGSTGEKGQLVGRVSWFFQSKTKFCGGKARTNERPGQRTSQTGTRETMQANKPTPRDLGKYHPHRQSAPVGVAPAGASGQARQMRARSAATTEAPIRVMKNRLQHSRTPSHTARQVDRFAGLQRKTKFSGVKLQNGRPLHSNLTE